MTAHYPNTIVKDRVKDTKPNDYYTPGPTERKMAERHRVWYEWRGKEFAMDVQPKGDRSTLRSVFWDRVRSNDQKAIKLTNAKLFRERMVSLRHRRNEMWPDIDRSIGWELGTYGMFETGRALPHATDIEELAMHFDVDLEYLVTGNVPC